MTFNGVKPQVRRLDSLTAIRFFAVIYVVLFHYSAGVIPFGPQLSSGYLGVDLFFVLSGFILMYNYGDKATTQSAFYRLFLSARIARIYPAFILAFVLATPAVVSFTLSRSPPLEAWAQTAVAGPLTLALVHAWFPRIVFFWNFPSWSVSVEMFFYLCFPLLATRLKALSERMSLLLALACALLAPGLVAFAITRANLPFSNMPWNLEAIPIVRLSQFVMGMAIGRVFLLRQYRANLSRVWAILACALTVCVVAFLPGLPFFARVLIPGPIFAMLIYVLARGERLQAKEKRFPLGGLVLLGDASYSIYILQWPLFYLCGFSLVTMTGPKLLFYLCLLLAASIASLLLVEKPLRRKILSVLAVARLPHTVKIQSLRFGRFRPDGRHVDQEQPILNTPVNR